VSWFYESASSGADPELARGIARKLCRDSLAWARTLVASLRPSPTRRQLEEELFAEVMAYGLCLLELRLSEAAPADHGALGDLVRHECGVLVEQASWRRRTRYKRLPDLAAAPSGSRYAQIYPAGKAGGRGHARLTKEMFEQFSQCTGLGSEVLVGKGENLASLVFYIAVHGVFSAGGLLTCEEVLKLLRTARECRTHFHSAIPGWLGAESEAPSSTTALLERGPAKPRARLRAPGVSAEPSSTRASRPPDIFSH
jgi:hypothetical protein